jgi:hypothetical protein
MARPLAARWCYLSWLSAGVLFFGALRLVHAPTEDDAGESLYSTWAIAHGNFACAYPPAGTFHFPSIAHPGPFIAPVWPLISGALAAVLRIGHSVPFPSATRMGPGCAQATAAVYHWSVQSSSAQPSARLGEVSWLVLLVGVIALLRACGRGRSRWEALTVIVVAVLPIIWAPLLDYFHPQDLVAMGGLLAGLACARRDHWIAAGLLLGLAAMSQQFALLALAPLWMIAPRQRRLVFIAAAASIAALVVLPLDVVTSGRALHAVLIGSGNTASFGGTVIWETHAHGAVLVTVSRVFPIFAALGLAGWARARLGSGVLDPVPLLSLIATSLALRLVFEQNLFSYYFMALTTALLLLDIISGRVRGQLVGWIALVTVAFNPIPVGIAFSEVEWGPWLREHYPLMLMVTTLLIIAVTAVRGRVLPYLYATFLIITLAFAKFPPWTTTPPRAALPTWAWQLLLVTAGFWLALQPLLRQIGVASTGPAPGIALNARGTEGQEDLLGLRRA